MVSKDSKNISIYVQKHKGLPHIANMRAHNLFTDN